MIIVCNNDTPQTNWVVTNAVLVEVSETMITPFKRLANYGQYDEE